MKKILLLVLFSLAFTIGAFAQGTTATGTTAAATTADEKPKRAPIFRANKEQITQVQTLLKTKAFYAGDATGKLDATTRSSIKLYQKENGLKATGTLNRATLEKMGVPLTDKQKEIPANPNSYASTATKSSTDAKSGSKSTSDEKKPKKVIFRATKDQIMEAQKLLKSRSLYSGDETGKLNDATRDGLKRFQKANDLNVTGTLNQVTLEKMGIDLTDAQKGAEQNL